MARYPIFEEYQKSGNYVDGIRKCDELLRRNPNDIRLLTTKLQLALAVGADDAQVLEQLILARPRDLSQILAIEQALVTAQQDIFPAPLTVGPSVGKIWDNAVKAAAGSSEKLDILSLRFSQAVLGSRHVDAQHTLVQLKSLQPKNRALYLAHAAYTQMTSTSENDLQSRLAISLARKAVADKFDEDRRLDCRVSGQIFALQRSQPDLDTIKHRAFKESRQVYQELHLGAFNKIGNGSTVPTASKPSENKHHETFDKLRLRAQPILQSDSSPEDLPLLFSESALLFCDLLSSPEQKRSKSRSESCFLSMSLLVKLHATSGQTPYLFQAAQMCERLLQEHPEVHEARMVLVYVYSRLGLGTLAIRQFDALNIKEIQFDTVGHALFSGLSSLLPWPTSVRGNEVFDPLKRTANALNFYLRYEDRLADTLVDVLSHGQTGMIFDVQDLRDDLKQSVARRMTILEHRRIARLLGKDIMEAAEAGGLGPRVLESWLTFKDNRDFAATFNYGYNVEMALHGEVATHAEKAILRYLALDTAWSLSANKPTLTMEPKAVLAKLEDALVQPPTPEYDGPVAQLADKLTVLMLRSAIESELNQLKALEGLLLILSERPDTLLQQSDMFLCSNLRKTYVYLDLLRCIAALCSMLRKTNRSDLYHILEQIEDLLQSQHISIVQFASEQRQACTASHFHEALAASIGEAWAAQKNTSSSELQGFCEAIAKSADEGWYGVMRIKLR